MSAPSHRPAPAPTQGGFTHAVSRGSAYRYLAAVPDRAGPWPLLLFLHGSEERGRDLERVQRHGPPRLVAEGRRFPFIVLAPQCPCGHAWSPAKLEALLDQAEATWPVDTRRIWVTGLSMGGYGAWALALRCPGRLAALAPICGGGDVRQAHALHGLPIWAFHGALDDSVPLHESRNMVEAVNRAGGRARLTVYPEMGHDCWTRAYATPGLWKWMAAQRARAPLAYGRRAAARKSRKPEAGGPPVAGLPALRPPPSDLRPPASGRRPRGRISGPVAST